MEDSIKTSHILMATQIFGKVVTNFGQNDPLTNGAEKNGYLHVEL